jgi:CRP-like cAMP-binding protein
LALRPGAQPNSSCDIHQRVRLLEGLTSVQAEIVSEGAELLEFEAGARVVIEQRSNTTLFVVVDGCVEAVFEGAIIATVGPGEVFGEFAFLLGRPRTATVRAASRARVLAFSAGQLQRLAETHPEIAVHVFRNLARSVALKLDSHDDL